MGPESSPPQGGLAGKTQGQLRVAPVFWGPWMLRSRRALQGGSARADSLPHRSHACTRQDPSPMNPDLRTDFLAQALTCFTAVGLLGGHWAVSDPGYHRHT